MNPALGPMPEFGPMGPPFNSIVHRDDHTGVQSGYFVGEEAAPEEPVFVPRGSGEGEGWLLSLVGRRAENRNDLVVLDAHDQDPVPAEVRVPRHLGSRSGAASWLTHPPSRQWSTTRACPSPPSPCPNPCYRDCQRPGLGRWLRAGAGLPDPGGIAVGAPTPRRGRPWGDPRSRWHAAPTTTGGDVGRGPPTGRRPVPRPGGPGARHRCRPTRRGLALAEKIPTGIVHIDDQTVNDEANVPFGGVGVSGTGSRFGGPAANIDAFTEACG
jgi:Retinal pigment epithelial membrane protein/Aldehyde dehydrogenase family